MTRVKIETSDLNPQDALYIRNLRRYIEDTLRSIWSIQHNKKPNMELYSQRKMELNMLRRERDKFYKEKLKEI